MVSLFYLNCTFAGVNAIFLLMSRNHLLAFQEPYRLFFLGNSIFKKVYP